MSRIVETVASLIDAIRASQLLPPSELDVLEVDLRTAHHEPRTLADDLIRRNWLTPYQVDQLLRRGGEDLVLGPYILLECLGSGGMGRVYKARHQVMQRLVALKVIRSELLARPEVLARFQREIQAAAQVSHPNLVIAHDASEVQGVHFLVMEYVEGTTLARLLDAGPLAIRHACDYARQAAMGLQHIHEVGLVHRDIKPSNLLVASRGSVVKILDLGLARLGASVPSAGVLEDATRSGEVMGTPDYMSPEQALDPRKADIRSDIYSLGCTLYQMLTGRPPFPGGTFTQKLLWHQQAEPVGADRLRRSLPGDLVRTLNRMMAKAPEARPSTPADVVEALLPFCAASSARFLTIAPPPPPAPAPVDIDIPAATTHEVVRHEPQDASAYELQPLPEPPAEPEPPEAVPPRDPAAAGPGRSSVRPSPRPDAVPKSPGTSAIRPSPKPNTGPKAPGTSAIRPAPRPAAAPKAPGASAVRPSPKPAVGPPPPTAPNRPAAPPGFILEPDPDPDPDDPPTTPSGGRGDLWIVLVTTAATVLVALLAWALIVGLGGSGTAAG